MEGDGEGRREEGRREGGERRREERGGARGKREINREKVMERRRGVSFKRERRDARERKKRTLPIRKEVEG